MMTAAMIGSNKGQDCHGFGGIRDRTDSFSPPRLYFMKVAKLKRYRRRITKSNMFLLRLFSQCGIH